MGGENEEAYDETADLNYYNASLSVEIQADWEIHLPLPLTISRIAPKGGIADVIAGVPSVQQGPDNDLFFQSWPVIAGRNNSFERLG